MEATRTQRMLATWANNADGFPAIAVSGILAALDLAWWEGAQGALSSAGRRVLGSNTLAFMRAVSGQLVRAADVSAEFARIAADRNLSEIGRRDAYARVRVQQSAAIDQVNRNFDRAAERLVTDDFPPAPPRRIDPGDAARITVAIARVGAGLSPEEFALELGTALERKDVALLDALIPLARSRQPADVGDVAGLGGLAEIAARAEGLLVRPEEAAHVLVRALVERVSAQRDMLASELRSSGSARQSFVLRSTDGAGRRAPMFTELDPIPDSVFEGPPPISTPSPAPLT